MTAITVRLSAEDHKLLQLYCLTSGKSQNAIMTELLRTELDRALPGKRDTIRSAGPEALWDALGIPRPQPSGEARRWAADVISSLSDQTDPASSRPAA
jgi:hypothetical protein